MWPFFKNLSSKTKSCISVNSFAEGQKLIFDISVVSDKLNIGGYLVAVDIERTFGSLDHGS